MTKNTKDKLHTLIQDLNQACATKKSELNGDDSFSDTPQDISEIKFPLYENNINPGRELTDRFSRLENLQNETDDLFKTIVDHINSGTIDNESLYYENSKKAAKIIKDKIEAI